MKKVGLISVLVWLAFSVYGLFFNLTYIDEAKYLIKGWLMTTKQVGYYSTEGFFYQHMPGGLLWYGIGQKLLGPSLLLARIQSFVLGLLVFGFSFLTAKKLFNKKAALVTVGLLSLTPVVALYYSSAVPLSITAFLIMLGLWSLSVQKRALASVWFSLLLVTRENFLFSLGIYLLWLGWFYRKELWKHLLIILGVVLVFVIPGLPGILNVFKNFPGINLLMPISQVEKQVLVNWQQQTHSLDLFVRAIKEFGVIYIVWFLALLAILTLRKKIKVNKIDKPVWWLVQILFWFNLFAHFVAVWQLSPRAMVAYFAYVAPMGAVIVGGYLHQVKSKWLRLSYFGLLLTLPLVIFSSLFTQTNTINKLAVTRNALEEVIKGKDKIVWLAEPMNLYLTGKVSYYPLINHTNFFKTSQQTEVVKRLGFWNQEMMQEWLDQADMTVVDPNRLIIMKQVSSTRPFVDWFEHELKTNWEVLLKPNQILPDRLVFYAKSSTTL